MARFNHRREDDVDTDRSFWRSPYIGAGLVAASAVLAAAGLAAYFGSRKAAPVRRSKGSIPRRGGSQLQANAAKALRLKDEAGPQTTTPSHRTAHRGGVQGPQIGYSDTRLGKEATYTSNLKRSHNARSGDA